MTDDSQKIACDWCGQRVYPFDLHALASLDARVRELEALLREARHDLHYVIRVASSDSSTDMEFTKHARVLFADEIETIEKIDAALKGGTDG